MNQKDTSFQAKLQCLSEDLEKSQKLLTALGDESRQHLILAMMKTGDCSGVRVIDMAEHSSLSRPAISHHFQIMKDAGLLKTRKEGTKIYYYFDPDMKTMNALIRALQLAVEITGSLPDRAEE
jgi:ArsR family transcriptional regulator